MSLWEALSFFSQYFLNSLFPAIANSVFRFQQRQRWGNRARNQTASTSVQREALFGARAWCRGRGKDRCASGTKRVNTQARCCSATALRAVCREKFVVPSYWILFIEVFTFIIFTVYLWLVDYATLFPVKTGRWQSLQLRKR